MKSYSVVKSKAEMFANERHQNVYIAKAKKNNHYRIFFKPEEVTKNHTIIEVVKETKGE